MLVRIISEDGKVVLGLRTTKAGVKLLRRSYGFVVKLEPITRKKKGA